MASKRGIVIAPMSVGDILQNTTSVTVGANVLGQILFATPTIERLFGYTTDELLGKSITILMPERFKPMHKIGFKKWVETGELTYGGKELKVNGLHKDGREFPISVTIGSYYDGPDLRAVATIKDVRDVIELEEATEIMRRELNYTRSVTENIGIGIITTDINGIVLSINPKAEELTGYSEDDIIGRNGHEVLHKFNPDGSIERLEDCQIMKTLQSGQLKVIIDDFFKKKDGSLLNLDGTVAPMIRLDKVTGLVISFEDISDRKIREEALRESEERYRNLVELSPDPICVYAEGKFVYANRAALLMVGANSLEEVIGKSVLDFIQPDYHDIVINRMTEVMRTGKPLPLFHEKAKRIDGSSFDIEVASMPIIYNQTQAALTIIRDISGRIMQERRYELIAEGATDMIAMTGMDGKIAFANHPAHYISLGYKRGELNGLLLRDITHPDDLFGPEREAIVLESLQKGEKLPQSKARMKHKDGHYVWVEGTGALITQGNNITYFLSTVRDITDQMEREKRIEQFLDAIPQLVWTAHPNGDIFWYNDNWYRYTGQKEEEALNWGWEDVHHPDHIERVKKEWTHSIETGQPLDIQFPLRKFDGTYHWFLTRVNPIRENNKIVRWVGTNTDVDDSRKAYELKSRLAAIIESSQSAIIGKTLYGTITDWNPGAERLYGYTSKEVVDQNISIIVPDNKREELEGIMYHLRSGEKVVDLVTTRKKKDGTLIEINLISSPIYDIDGVIVGASTVATPIIPKANSMTPLQSKDVVEILNKERENPTDGDGNE